jgi:hypothetical protein
MSLSDIQRQVASTVLALPEADGFMLAGGAALIFDEVVDRATRDLDVFGPTVDAVDRLAPVVVDALRRHGLTVDIEQLNPGFARMRVSGGGQETLLDLGFDPATHSPTSTPLGAVRALDDLAGDKLLALFSRAAPRDFVDVIGLLDRYTREQLLDFAAAKDRGFSTRALSDAFGVLPTIRRDRFDVDDATYQQMIGAFHEWRMALDQGPPGDVPGR